MKKKLIALALTAAMAATMATTAMAAPAAETGDAAVIKELVNKYYNSWLDENGGSTVKNKEGTPICALQFTADGQFKVYFYDNAVETIADPAQGVDAIIDQLAGAGTGLIKTLNAAIQEYYTINPDATDVKVNIAGMGDFALSANKGAVDAGAFAQEVVDFYNQAAQKYEGSLESVEDYTTFLNQIAASDLAFTVMEGQEGATSFSYEMTSQTVEAISNTSASATTETQVTYYVAPSYSVYIPEVVTLDSTATIYATEMNLVEGTKVDVKIEKNEKTTMATTDPADTKFAVKLGDTELAYNINTNYKVGDVLTSFDTVGESKVTFSAPLNQPSKAGVYTGTLLFSVGLAAK